VVMGDDADAGQYVIADAVRVQPVAAPTIDLNWTSGGITGPTSASTQSTFTISRTYNITDSAGQGPSSNFVIGYYASPDTNFADATLLGSETISAAADKTVGTHSGTSPALQVNGNGTYYLFAKLDSNNDVLETNKNNNVAQAPAPVVVSGPVIVDDSNPGFSETGSGWGSNPTLGYNGEYQYHQSTPGATDTANWQVTGLAAGSYAVQLTWVGGYGNRPTDTPIWIYDGSTLLTPTPIRINQNNNPQVNTVVNGSTFQTLLTVNIASGTVKVVMGDDADAGQYVIADAVRVAPNV